jgi:hypothetical protein
MAAKRELIDPGKRGKRFVRRDTQGQFTDDHTSVGRSLTRDRRRAAKANAKKGQGDKGDRKPARRRKGSRRASRRRG